MAYYLTIGNKNKIIDLTKAKYFTKLSNFKTPGACSLKEIDGFSIMFDNEEELKEQLFNENLLEEEDFNKSLSIKIKRNNKYSKVIYDLLYQNDAWLLAPASLRLELISRANDYEFLDKFIRFFYNYYECLIEISELGVYLTDSKSGIKSKYLDNKYEEVINKLIYNYEEVNYKNIHTLIAFISNYDKKNNNKNKPKIKSKKKKEVIGQTSLFD